MSSIDFCNINFKKENATSSKLFGTKFLSITKKQNIHKKVDRGEVVTAQLSVCSLSLLMVLLTVTALAVLLKLTKDTITILPFGMIL